MLVGCQVNKRQPWEGRPGWFMDDWVFAGLQPSWGLPSFSPDVNPMVRPDVPYSYAEKRTPRPRLPNYQATAGMASSRPVRPTQKNPLSSWYTGRESPMMRFPGGHSAAAPAGRDSPLLALQFRDYDATLWQPQLGPVGYQMMQQASSVLATPPQSATGVAPNQVHAQTVHPMEAVMASLTASFAAVPPQTEQTADIPQKPPSTQASTLVTPAEDPPASQDGQEPVGSASATLSQTGSAHAEVSTSGTATEDQAGEDGANSISAVDEDGDNTPMACSVHTDMKRSRLRPLRSLRSNKRKFRCHACTDILEAFVARCGEKPTRPQKNEVLPDIGLNRKQLDFWLANRRRIKKRQRLRRLQREASQVSTKQEPQAEL